MRKLILVLGLILVVGVTNCYSANEFREGSGVDTILGSEVISDIDIKIFQNIVDPLDRLLGKYRRGATLVYNSASSIDITAGEISCQNTAGTITRMRQNTSTTTLTWADIDTGAEASSTTYYVYGVCDADATTFTGVMSVNSSTPDSGAATYYKLLGSFFNDADGDMVDGSIETPAEEPDIAIKTVYDYGTSYSSSTSKTTGVFIAYGQARDIAGSSTQAVTNLPFTNSSTYTSVCVPIGTQSGSIGLGFVTSQDSGSQFTIRNNHSDNVGDNGDCNWMAIGH